MHTTSYSNSACRSAFEGKPISRLQAVVRALLVVAILAASASAAQAVTVTASWDPNPEPDIASYVLSWGTQTGQYPNSQNVGNVTTWQLNLAPGRYFFIVQAVNTSNLTSVPSTEVVFDVGGNTAPVLTQPANQTSAENTSPSLQLVASDPQGNPLTFSATGLPPGLSVNSSTGLISGSLSFTSSGTYNVTASVSDGALADSKAFTWTVTNVNRAPTLTQPANQTNAENASASLQLSGSDPDGQTLTYSATNLPGGLSVNASSGLISGTLSFTSAGSYNVTATVSDGSLTNSKTFTWTVTNVNRAPTLTQPANQSGAENSSPSLQLAGSDPDGDTLTYSATNLPNGLSINTSSGLISGTLSFTSAGSYNITATVSDGSLNNSKTFTWTVTNVNRAPTLTQPANQSGAENSSPSLQLVASDPDADTLTYSATNLPNGLSINTSSGLISGTLSFTSAGSYNITATVSDGSLNNSKTFTWTVNNTNRAPSLTQPVNQTGTQNATASLQLAGTDPDGDTLTYSATNLPGGLSVNASTGLISGTLTAGGSFTVTAIVSDGSLTDSKSFTWTVQNANTAPSLTAPSNQLVSDSGAYAQAVFADTPLSYWRLGEVSGTTAADHVSTNNGTVSGTVTMGLVGALSDGDAAMDFSGADGTKVAVPNSSGLAAINSSSAFAMEAWINPGTTVLPSNYRLFYSFPGQPASYLGLYNGGSGLRAVVALVINGTQRSFMAGPMLNVGTWYHIVATYDGAALTLYINGTAAGQLTGLSGVVSVGTGGVLVGGYPIAGGQYSFDGGVDEAALYTHSLTPAQIANHYALRNSLGVSLQITGSDPEGDTLTYSATGLPVGLSINPTTGVISGTLTAASAGPHTVTVTVSDGTLSTSKTFSWTIVNTNRAPVLLNPGNQPSGGSDAYVQTVLSDTPAAYWRFGETSGAVVADRLGSSPGMLAGGSAMGQGGAFVDNAAISFSGADGARVNVANSAALTPLSGAASIAFETWINPQAQTVPSHYQIFLSFPDSPASYLGVMDTAGVLRTVVALVINGAQRSFVAGPALTVGSWYHVVATYDGSALTLYVNGVAVGQLTGLSGPASTGSGNLQIGGYPIAGGYGFNGRMDEPAVYMHSLTPTQVAAHYARRTYAKAILADTPVSYWRLGESGASATDYSGSNNGSLLGSVTPGQAGALADGNKAMRFNGLDGTNIRVPNSSGLAAINASTGFAMETWVNPQTSVLPSGYRLFYSFPDQPASYLGLYNGGSGLRVVVALVINGTQRSFVAGPTLSVGTWYHVAATYDGAALTLYINGSAVGQLTGLSGPVSIGNGGVMLGGYPISGGQYSFDGVLDEPAIYAHSLTPGQIASHYAMQTSAADNAVALQLLASDADGDTLTYSATGLPPDLGISTTTGLISGTLTPASVGTYSVTVTASDGALSNSQSFTWVVAP